MSEVTYQLNLKTRADKGNLVYEYNPLHNYRDDSGEIKEFISDKFNFDLNHPVDIISDYSYDGTVNLILNDEKNESRLINTRFSSRGNDTYEIIDRKGNADTNIYDKSEFDLDTSLYKKTNNIPTLTFINTFQGGSLPVGNYHFYFKYTDGDDNDTDFVAESGLVSVFIGEIPVSINTGIEDENSNKLVKFKLTDIDSSYAFVKVYYTRSSAAYNESSITKACCISKKYIISNNECNITITGSEEKIDISLAEINERREYYTSAKTQAICQNRLFLANLKKAELPYQDLEDISLRFLPYLGKTEYDFKIDSSYITTNGINGTYYDPNAIYYKLGYWPDEYYRLGVVYILSDGTLSPVFNIRGTSELQEPPESPQTPDYADIPIFSENNVRNIISYDVETKLISGANVPFENVKGVIKFPKCDVEDNGKEYIYYIVIKYSADVIDYLKQNLHIKGFFFVRQKRLQTTLCQALTVGVDRQSHLPAPKVGEHFIIERFFDNNRNLDASLENRIYKFSDLESIGAFCPDYDINYPFYNNFFTGEEFTYYEEADVTLSRTSSIRHIIPNSITKCDHIKHKGKIIGIQDSTQIVVIDDYKWSAKAGIAEEAYRFSYLGYENKITKASNLVRGAFGPYIGITGIESPNKLITIKIPGFDETKIGQYIEIRAEDESPFYAISDRIDINKIPSELEYETDVFRGDCYICQFTHRINRNFQDPEAPNNSSLVDPNTWIENYDVEDIEKNADINRGDVNAVELGLWITFKVRSSRNLNIRTVDISHVSEQSLTGHYRTFYPHTGLNTDGSYKIPEALVYNDGFSKSVSDYWNILVPDVPYLQDNFTNRIAYSDISVTNSFKNGFRIFKNGNYRDYNMEYGAITKIVSFFNNIICVFEHGIAKIPVNERAVAGSGSGGDVFINTSNVLPQNPLILSHNIGSQWQESIITTTTYIYGVDTVSKKIWRCDGEKVEIISNFSIQKFLNENITLGEREKTPIIGIRNVKSHYNKFKQDVLFTFYDNLEGFEEKSWNICWSELLNKWITFYSWIPSYSENINNVWFTFNRDLSKIFSKAQICLKDSPYSNGIVLDEVFWDSSNLQTEVFVKNNGELISGSILNLEILKDPFGNYKYFQWDNENKRLKFDPIIEGTFNDKPYYYLNLNLTLQTTITIDGSNSNVSTPYEGQVIIINKHILDENKNLDISPFHNYFWKHGQGGLIEAAGKILPCNWYAQNHPFEFEFVVAENPQVQKIFENLQIISNNVAPESFHYEIVGDGYDFSDDKKNMFFRQEATKEFYQFNGSDIVYDERYKDIQPSQRAIKDIDDQNTGVKDKSTIFPLYYSRQDTINEIYDCYKQLTAAGKDYNNLSGSEIVFDELLNQFSILMHAKGVDITKHGRIRGNMHYKEDKWDVQINPITFKQKNEQSWTVPPLCVRNTPIPPDVKENLSFPSDMQQLGYEEQSSSFDLTEWTTRKETKPRDKFIKIKVRYYNNGDQLDLVVISALKTLYTMSYA